MTPQLKRRQPLMRIRRVRERGVALVEALLALLIMSFGMMALVELMSSLRRAAEGARERGEAMQLAQAELSEVRSFAVLTVDPARPELKPYSAIASRTQDPMEVAGSHTDYRVKRTATPIFMNGAEVGKDVAVNVSWRDRAGDPQFVQLSTWLARIDPAFSGALSIEPHAESIRLPGERHAAIPTGAKDLGNGTSAFKPVPGGASAWVFSNASGMVTKTCAVDPALRNTALSLAALPRCNDVAAGYLLTGAVSFSYDSDAGSSEHPTSPPFALDIALDVTSTGHPATKYDCLNDSATALKQVSFFCIVYGNSDSPPSWSGRLRLCDASKPADVADAYHCRTLAPVGSAYRVCRYTANYDQALSVDPATRATTFTISNFEHPLDYTKVTASLSRQNLLIVKNAPGSRCPTAPAVNPATGIYVDYSTREVQPTPDPWPGT